MLADLFYRLRAIFRRRAVESELDQELRFHIECQAEKYIEAGMTPEEAARRARLDFGGRDQMKEECRSARGVALIETSMQDLTYGFRQLRRNPGFTFIAVATIALGIGANTAVFSVMNAVLFAKPPYSDPARLITIWQSYPAMGEVRGGASAAEYLDYRNRNSTFLSLAGYQRLSFDLTGNGPPERVSAARATSNLFDTLGIVPQVGRTFTEAEDRADAANVAVISDAFWHRYYNGSPSAVGSTLKLNEQVYTVIGVMPRAFEFPNSNTTIDEAPALWIPMAFPAQEIAERAANLNVGMIGRLQAGATIEQAHQDVHRIASDFQRELSNIYNPINPLRVTVELLGAAEAARARPALLALGTAVLFVLLIACANVANLLLARAQTRHREMAMRRAIGASAGRLKRQLLTESVLLTLIGGGAGYLLAQIFLSIATSWWSDQVVGLRGARLDTTVLFFMLSLSVITGIVCGLAPALGWGGVTPMIETLKQAGRHLSSASPRLRIMLVTIEVACAVLLLIGSGLLVRSFVNLLKVPPGFDPNGVLIVRTTFNRQRYSQDTRRHQAERDILNRIGELPGVRAVALATHIPLADSRQIGFNVEGHDPNERVWSWNTLVSANYFAAMGIPLRRGRTFDSRGIPDRPLEIVVNESMAREYWPNQEAIGKRIRWGDRLLTIVGIAGDVRLSALDAAPPPTVYGDVFETVSGATMNAVFVIRQQTSDPERMKTAVEKIIWSVDPGLPVFGTRTLETVISRSLATREFTMTILTGFGAVSLLLATIGVYGLLSYTVSQRTREFGVRLALGSPPSDLRRLVLWNGMGVLTVGVAGGLLLSVLCVPALSTLLFGLDPLDPLTFFGVGGLLLAVGLFASYVPAWRATRVDPMVALRHE